MPTPRVSGFCLFVFFWPEQEIWLTFCQSLHSENKGKQDNWEQEHNVALICAFQCGNVCLAGLMGEYPCLMITQTWCYVTFIPLGCRFPRIHEPDGLRPSQVKRIYRCNTYICIHRCRLCSHVFGSDENLLRLSGLLHTLRSSHANIFRAPEYSIQHSWSDKPEVVKTVKTNVSLGFLTAPRKALQTEIFTQWPCLHSSSWPQSCPYRIKILNKKRP